MKFLDLDLQPEVVRAITEKGYENPTDIQIQAIPMLLTGRDLLAQSQTGTGKTAAFSLPLVSALEHEDKMTQALILCPTRELGIQVADEIRSFAKYKNGLRVVTVYGGESIERQIRDLKKGADIVVATPGRLMDHIRRKTIRLNNCKHVVLDEADEMLNMGFVDDIREIFTFLPEERQMAFFSATMPQEIVKLSDDFLTEPNTIRLSRNNLTVSRIEQVSYVVDHNQKLNLLIQLLQIHDSKGTMIFCNTKKMVDELATELNKAGFPALGLHGDMKQEMRSMVMGRFKRGMVKVLIATDVAARGIDVDSMDVVINYDIPQELEYYVHRIGRTGRAGKEGLAITLVNRRQRYALRQIERLANSTIKELPLPTKEQLNEVLVNKITGDIKKWADLEPGKLFNVAYEGLRKANITQEEIILAFINKSITENNLLAIKSDTPTKTVNNPGLFSQIRLSIGDDKGIRANHVVSAIAKAVGIPGSSIGKIRIKENSTLVDIPQEHVQHAIKEIEKTTIKGHPVEVFLEQEEVANTPRKRSKDGSKSRDNNRRRGDDRRSSDRKRRPSDDKNRARSTRKSGEGRRAK